MIMSMRDVYRQQRNDERWKAREREIKIKAGNRCAVCLFGVHGDEMVGDPRPLSGFRTLEANHLRYPPPPAPCWEVPDEWLECLCSACHRWRSAWDGMFPRPTDVVGDATRHIAIRLHALVLNGSHQMRLREFSLYHHALDLSEWLSPDWFSLIHLLDAVPIPDLPDYEKWRESKQRVALASGVDSPTDHWDVRPMTMCLVYWKCFRSTNPSSAYPAIIGDLRRVHLDPSTGLPWPAARRRAKRYR